MEWLYTNGIGTIVISSGEFNNEGRTEFIENIVGNTIEKSQSIDCALRVGYSTLVFSVGKERGLFWRKPNSGWFADG